MSGAGRGPDMPNECPSGKERYVRPKEAHDAAAKIRARHGFDADAYHCHSCDGWRITGHTRKHQAFVARRTKPKAQPYNRHDRSWLREVEL